MWVDNGTERTADIGSDLTWSLATSDATVYDQAGVVTEAENESWPTEVRPGGTVEGQAVFDVDPSLLSGGTLSVETYDDDYNEVYVDFQL